MVLPLSFASTETRLSPVGMLGDYSLVRLGLRGQIEHGQGINNSSMAYNVQGAVLEREQQEDVIVQSGLSNSILT